MYHSSTSDINKEKILKSVTEETKVRVVFATSALGCGVNAKNVTFVCHFGPSYDLTDYCQQIGRAGRGTTVDM